MTNDREKVAVCCDCLNDIREDDKAYIFHESLNSEEDIYCEQCAKECMDDKYGIVL